MEKLTTKKSGETARVIAMPGCEQYALFHPGLRTKLEDGVKSYTDKPTEVVESFEQILCTHIVSGARVLAGRLAAAAGKKLGKKLASRGFD